MKITVGIIFLIFFGCFASAQENISLDSVQKVNTRHLDGDWYFGAAPVMIRNSHNFPSGMVMGLKSRVFIGEHFSFDADIVFGRDYRHMSLGVIGLTVGLINTIFFWKDDKQPDIFFGILMLLAVEHFAYHGKLGANTDISPYVSLLRYTALKRSSLTDNPKEEQNGFAIGIELNQYKNRFSISPFIEYYHSYSSRYNSVQFGIYLGYNWFGKP